ncbi:MAG TPA: SgcJ/EcaC family oxidoreductase [Caulobacteraceae bacterium]|nr:SgcJ/EcaC family oxidoreductase [Caulobacteraceae bacterium]
MSHRISIGLACASVAALAASVALAAAPPAAAPERPAAAAAKPAGPGDKARIEALEARFAAAFNAKDVAKIMSFYSREGLFVFDVSPPREHVGWEDYKKDWEGLFATTPGPVTFKISDLSVTVVGPVAYGHSIQDLRWTAANGQAAELTVRVTDVYREQAGKWRIVQEHVSAPVDLDTGKADLLSKP